MPDPTPGERAYVAWWHSRWPLDTPPHFTPYGQCRPAEHRAWEAAAQAVRITMAPCHFRFAVGQQVRWAIDPEAIWHIVTRRYEEAIGRCTITYHLVKRQDAPIEDCVATAYENDLEAPHA